MCSTCGTTLVAPPSDATTTTNSNAIRDRDISEQLLNEMRQASRDLGNILGNLRGQVQDLDVLTRDILQEQENRENTDNLPREVWDPQHATSGPRFRPTSEDALKKIPRFVLNDQSTLFRQATLQVTTTTDLAAAAPSCCLLSTAPVASKAGSIPLPLAASSVASTAAKTNGNTIAATLKNNAHKFDCVLGEFGPAGEFVFKMGTTSLVLASPVTGKGGFDSETKARISLLSNNNKTNAAVGGNDSSGKAVIVFMQRGDGLTYVQKARMAQEAGAAAVIIGNNTSTPWPYVMKDSKGESKKPGQSISIPVAMIKEVYAQEIIRVFETQKQIALEFQQRSQPQPPIPKQIVVANEKQQKKQKKFISSAEKIEMRQEKDEHNDRSANQHNLFHLSCDLTITEQSCDCSVCCEQLQNSETVIQLPGCGHVFHEACALVWLKSHNTCPYCRRELPTDDPEYERERRQRQQHQQRTNSESRNSSNRENENHNGASFYG